MEHGLLQVHVHTMKPLLNVNEHMRISCASELDALNRGDASTGRNSAGTSASFTSFSESKSDLRLLVARSTALDAA